MGMSIILSIIIMGVIFNYYYTPTYRTLLDNITFFYTGVLIAYLFNKREIKKIKISPYIISICQFIIITLLLFVNSVNSGDINYVRNFILHYFLNNNQTYRDEASSYVGPLEMYYFHNLVGQIKEILINIRTGGGYKKRKCMSLTNKRHRKYRYSRRRRPSTKRRTSRRRR